MSGGGKAVLVGLGIGESYMSNVPGVGLGRGRDEPVGQRLPYSTCDTFSIVSMGHGTRRDLLEHVGDGLPQGADEPLHQVLSQARVLGAVGLDEALVDAPGGLDRGVAIISEEVLQALCLGVGEQAGPGVQGASGPVEPVTCPAPPARDRLLGPAAALVELAGSQGHDARRGP